jgi:UDP-N-acetylglucosamine acyltransferase
VIHPTALIDPRAQLDPTVQVGAYAIIEGTACISAGCRIEAHAQIIGDVKIGAGTVIGRAAVIGTDPQDLSFTPDTASGVDIGEKNVIREHVTIHRGSQPGSRTRIGSGNFIMVGAHFGHDVQTGDGNIFANACLLGGHVRVGNRSFIGGGAVFHQFVRVGDHCVVQGNGALGKDLPHYCMMQRVNRMTGLNIVGLRRAGFTREDRAAMKELFDLLFRSGHNLTQAIALARQKAWSESAEKLLTFVETPTKRGICPVRGGVVEEE